MRLVTPKYQNDIQKILWTTTYWFLLSLRFHFPTCSFATGVMRIWFPPPDIDGWKQKRGPERPLLDLIDCPISGQIFRRFLSPNNLGLDRIQIPTSHPSRCTLLRGHLDKLYDLGHYYLRPLPRPRPTLQVGTPVAEFSYSPAEPQLYYTSIASLSFGHLFPLN